MKKQSSMPLLNKQEIAEIFSSSFLYENKSFFVIDKETSSYDTKRSSKNFIEEASYVRSKFQSGHTIIVKNLESYNTKIRKKCAELGPDVDVHMYLVSEIGDSSFLFHKDDRDVLIHMLYGEKDFFFRMDSSLHETSTKLGPCEELFIPQGQQHKALPKGSSCLLSFGIKKNIDYFVPGGVLEIDLE